LIKQPFSILTEEQSVAMCSKNNGLAYLQAGIAWKAAKNSRTKAEHGGGARATWG